MTEHMRMTRDALAVATGACDHALRLGHRYLGSEHFLLALAAADQRRHRPARAWRHAPARRGGNRPPGRGRPVRRPRPGRAGRHRDRRQRRARLHRGILRTGSPDLGQPGPSPRASPAKAGPSPRVLRSAGRDFPPALPWHRSDPALRPACGARPARHPDQCRAPRSRPPRRRRRPGAFYSVGARRVSSATARRDPRPLPAGELIPLRAALPPEAPGAYLCWMSLR